MRCIEALNIIFITSTPTGTLFMCCGTYVVVRVCVCIYKVYRNSHVGRYGKCLQRKCQWPPPPPDVQAFVDLWYSHHHRAIDVGNVDLFVVEIDLIPDEVIAPSSFMINRAG